MYAAGFIRNQIVFSTLLAGALLGAMLAGAAEKAGQPLKGVSEIAYTGWNGSWQLDAPDAETRAVVVPAIGGRIIRYALDGENIIFEPVESAGKTLASSKESFWAGGYQCDLGPELRSQPQHQNLWMGPWTAKAVRNYTVSLTSEPDKIMGMQLTKDITIDPDTGEMGIVQGMKNTSDKDTAYGLWDRTLCKGGGFAFFPLNKKSRFPAKWSLRRKVEGKWVYDGVKPELPNVKILNGVLVVRADGPFGKVGADSDAGWIAYVRGKLLFIKFFPYQSYGNYSDGGNSVEAYWDEKVAELEPLSPEQTLKPGESYTFPEKWVLLELPNDVITFEQARELVKRIPKFKF